MNFKSSKAVHVVLSQWRDFKLIIIDVVFACCKCCAKFLKFKALERVSLLHIWASSDSSFLNNHLEGFEGFYSRLRQTNINHIDELCSIYHHDISIEWLVVLYGLTMFSVSISSAKSQHRRHKPHLVHLGCRAQPLPRCLPSKGKCTHRLKNGASLDKCWAARIHK